LGSKRFLLVHGTPRDPLDEYLMKDVETWTRRVQGSGADIVCVGHTHMQFNLRAGDSIVLNPGSVGQPRDGDPRAAYAIIDDGRIELNRVAYPVDDTVARIEATDLPERAKRLMAEVLRTGRMPSQGADPDEDAP
jgi:predicted phosphodiesterase